MNRLIGVLTLLAAMAAASGAALAQEKKRAPDSADLVATGEEKGWVSLFDGKTLGGWKTYDGKGQWEVEDGVIHGSGPASHLFSPRGDYKNFRYRAEFKIADKANSGMYFRDQVGPGFPKGYEVQVNSTHRDPFRTGSLYSFVP